MSSFFQSGRRIAHKLAILFLFVGLAGRQSRAQIFHLQGGSSSLVDAHGGSIGFQAPGYEGGIGAGMVNGQMRFGALVRTDFFDYKLTAGDDTLRFTLPTDIFNDNQYFFGRGLGLSQRKGKTTWSVFGGATSTVIGAPFFQAAKPDRAFGLFFMESRLTPHLKFFSRNVVSGKQTFINGLSYEARPWLKMAASGGVGGNAPYRAVSLVADRRLFTFKASYIGADRRFRRVSLENPLNSEVTRENLALDFHPNAGFGFSLSRQHFLSPLQSTSVSQEALVNQASVTTAWQGFRTNSSLYLSESEGQRNLGYLVDASRPIGRNLEAGITFNRNEPQSGKASQTFGGRIREIFGRRFSLTQYLSHAGGQTAFNFGGDFNSNRLTVSVSHAVTYAPFRPASAGGPFVNVYNVSIRFRLFQQLELNAQSNVAPDGRVRYTTSVSNYLYRYAGLMPGEMAATTSIGKYLVKGVVLDEQNNPIAGAALRINGEIAFTDSEGHFVVRLSKRGRERLEVAFEDFLTPTIYELVSAPSHVDATLEQDAQDVTVVLRRVSDPEKIRQIRSQLLAKQQGTPAPRAGDDSGKSTPASNESYSSSRPATLGTSADRRR